MDGMTLLIFHIFAIGVIIAATAIIAYNAGKNRGSFLSEDKLVEMGKVLVESNKKTILLLMLGGYTI